MDSATARILLRHGTIILLFGLAAGVPFWLAIVRARGEARIRAWRVAHTTLISDGLLLLAVGLMADRLLLSPLGADLLVWTLVASAYGFVFALIAGAGRSRRGLVPWPWGMNTLYFLGHGVGAAGAVLGVMLVLYGLR